MAGCDFNTSLLIHCDNSGTSFTDSNCNASGAKVLTAIGGATTSLVTKKFGAGSLSLDGVNSTLSVADFTWANGTNAWEWDFQVYATDFAGGDFDLLSQYVDANNLTEIRYRDTQKLLYFNYVSGGVSIINTTIPWTPSAGQFYHIQVGRDASNVYMFINGVLGTVTYVTGSGATSIPDLSATIYLGGRTTVGDLYLKGFMDEIRCSSIVRNTTTFTPPDSAYTAPGGLTARGLWGDV